MRVSRMLAAWVITGSLGVACTMVSAQYDVSRDFRIAVQIGDKPVAGLRVEVGPNSSVTDKDGIAYFRSVTPGTYAIRTFRGDYADTTVKVSPNGGLYKMVPLHWPDVNILRTRSLRGILRGPGFSGGEALDLTDLSGKILRRTQTGAGGEFQFDGVPRGIYFLNSNPSSAASVAKHIAVSIDPDALTDHLDIDLAWSSCGFSYTDRSLCDASELHLALLRGQVSDQTGAVIHNAEVELSDGPRILVRAVSDQDGRFDSAARLSGTYDLIVRMAGFQAMRRRVTLDPSDEGGKESALTVQLAIGGVCSSARVQ